MVDRSSFDAQYGMLITSEGSDEKMFVEAIVWQSDTCFTVAIENIAVENYARNYTAKPYVRVTYADGEERVIVGTKGVTRSIYTVANGLLQSGEIYDEGVANALKAYVNAK